MTHNPQSDQFPDIWQPVPSDNDPDHDTIEAQNESNGAIYQAARYILINDFNASDQLPVDPQDFPGIPGQLTDAQIAQMVAVQGILVSANWDPTMGKTKPASDDLLVDVDGSGANTVIDRRFVKAVVEAVKDYTSHQALYQKCLDFLRLEGRQKQAASQAKAAKHNQPQA